MPVRPVPTCPARPAVGILVGMTSVGSGSLIVTTLLLLYPLLRPSILVGTDLTQAVPMLIAGAIAHAGFGDISVAVVVSLLIGQIPGVWIGARMSSRYDGHALRWLLMVVLAATALKLLGVSSLMLGRHRHRGSCRRQRAVRAGTPPCQGVVRALRPRRRRRAPAAELPRTTVQPDAQHRGATWRIAVLALVRHDRDRLRRAGLLPGSRRADRPVVDRRVLLRHRDAVDDRLRRHHPGLRVLAPGQRPRHHAAALPVPHRAGRHDHRGAHPPHARADPFEPLEEPRGQATPSSSATG